MKDTSSQTSTAKYIRAGWVAYAFGVALTAMAGGPVAIVAVGGVAVMVVASILVRG